MSAKDDDWELDEYERCVAQAYDDLIGEGVISKPLPYTEDFERLWDRVRQQYPSSKHLLWPTLLQVRGPGLTDDDDEGEEWKQ